MDTELIEQMRNSFDFAISEVVGGWVLMYSPGYYDNGDEGTSTSWDRQIFTDEETMTLFILGKMRALKLHRTANAVKKEHRFKTYSDTPEVGR